MELSIMLDTSDICNDSHRSAINHHKKNKGVKRSGGAKYIEASFWKRARNIRFHRQSREDNFAGPELNEFESEPEPVCKSDPKPVCKSEPVREPERICEPAWVVVVPTPWRHTATARLRVCGVPPQLVLYRSTYIGPVSTDLIHLTVRQIEYFMEENGVSFTLGHDIAIWCCCERHHYACQIRLWHRNGMLILEPGHCDGDFRVFMQFYERLIAHLRRV